jgi:hypothetical protein
MRHTGSRGKVAIVQPLSNAQYSLVRAGKDYQLFDHG